MDKIKIIAEIGWNHMGDMQLAKKMIEEAAKSGATYAKFQTWSVDRLKSGAWDTDGRREIYVNAELSKSDHEFLFETCLANNIKFMSSVFSIPDANMLIDLGYTEAVKIPSFESRNAKLIKYCLANFENIYISLGTTTLDEFSSVLYDDVYTNWKYGSLGNLHLMHCVSSYPLNAKDANIRRMILMKEKFKNVPIGYSDHMEGVESAKIAIELGATVIEKHFTTDRNLPGRDNKFACLPEDIKNLTDYLQLREDMLSKCVDGYQACEADSRENYTGRFNG